MAGRGRPARGGRRGGGLSGFGHVDLRVSDLETALPFFDALLPELGFTERYHGAEWKVWAQVEPALPATAYFGITESRAHVPNDNRVAFWVSSAAGVDRLARWWARPARST